MTPLINNPPNQSIIIKHEPTISPPEKAIKTFACNICDQLFTRKDKLKRHIENIHMKERPFSCNHCSFKCYRRDRIKKHMMSEHVNHPNDFMYQPCNIHIDLSAHSITPTVDGNVNASPQTIPLGSSLDRNKQLLPLPLSFSQNDLQKQAMSLAQINHQDMIKQHVIIPNNQPQQQQQHQQQQQQQQ